MTYPLLIGLWRHLQRRSVLDRLHARAHFVQGFDQSGQVRRIVWRLVVPLCQGQRFHATPEHRHFGAQILKGTDCRICLAHDASPSVMKPALGDLDLLILSHTALNPVNQPMLPRDPSGPPPG